MEITIVIDDEILKEPVNKAVAIAVNQEVRKVVDKKIQSIIAELDKTIDRYLEQSITPEVVKKMIDNTTVDLLRERIEQISRNED